MSTVLLVGEDEDLLRTRAAVVRISGAKTICCGAASALAGLQGQPCELVILCHSLQPELITSLISAINSHWPETRILLLSSSREWGEAESSTEADIVCSADPELLVLRTVELLERRGPQPEKLPAGFAVVQANSCRH